MNEAPEFDQDTPRAIRITSQLISPPWLMAWLVILLVIVALLYGLREAAIIIQGYGVLLLQLHYKNRGNLPAISVIALVSFGLIPIANKIIFVDLAALLSAVLLFRFGAEPPQFLRNVMQAKMTWSDYAAITVLVVMGFSLSDDIGKVFYEFNTSVTWGFLLLAVLALRQQIGFLAVLGALCTVTMALGLFPEFTPDGVVVFLGWCSSAAIYIVLVAILVSAMRFDHASSIVALSLGLFLAFVSMEYTAVIANVFSGLLPRDLLDISDYGITVPPRREFFPDPSWFVAFFAILPLLLLLHYARDTANRSTVAALSSLGAAAVILGLLLFFSAELYPVSDTGGSSPFTQFNIFDLTNLFLAFLVMAFVCSLPQVGWNRYVKIPYRSYQFSVWATAFLGTFAVLILLKWVFGLSISVLEMWPRTEMDLDRDTLDQLRAPETVIFVAALLLMPLLAANFVALTRVLELNPLDYVREALNETNHDRSARPFLNFSNVGLAVNYTMLAVRERFSMLGDWVQDSAMPDPPPSLVDALLGRNMRWVILGVTGFLLIVWVFQLSAVLWISNERIAPTGGAALPIEEIEVTQDVEFIEETAAEDDKSEAIDCIDC